MSQTVDEPVRTFSIGFRERRYSELDKARLVARMYGTEHHELVVEPSSAELLPALTAHYDEPSADPSALPSYHDSKLAGDHVKVVLSGDGSDERFLGHTLFRGLKLAHYAQSLPAALREAVAQLGTHGPRTGNASLDDRVAIAVKRVVDRALPPELAFKAQGLGTSDAVRPLLSPEMRRLLEHSDPFATVDHWLDHYAIDNGAHLLERFVRTGLQTSLAVGSW